MFEALTEDHSVITPKLEARFKKVLKKFNKAYDYLVLASLEPGFKMVTLSGKLIEKGGKTYVVDSQGEREFNQFGPPDYESPRNNNKITPIGQNIEPENQKTEEGEISSPKSKKQTQHANTQGTEIQDAMLPDADTMNVKSQDTSSYCEAYEFFKNPDNVQEVYNNILEMDRIKMQNE